MNEHNSNTERLQRMVTYREHLKKLEELVSNNVIDKPQNVSEETNEFIKDQADILTAIQEKKTEIDAFIESLPPLNTTQDTHNTTIVNHEIDQAMMASVTDNTLEKPRDEVTVTKEDIDLEESVKNLIESIKQSSTPTVEEAITPSVPDTKLQKEDKPKTKNSGLRIMYNVVRYVVFTLSILIFILFTFYSNSEANNSTIFGHKLIPVQKTLEYSNVSNSDLAVVNVENISDYMPDENIVYYQDDGSQLLMGQILSIENTNDTQVINVRNRDKLIQTILPNQLYGVVSFSIPLLGMILLELSYNFWIVSLLIVGINIFIYLLYVLVFKSNKHQEK